MEENKIYNKDGMEELKNLPNDYFDLTITDPPYGIGKMVSGTMSRERLHKTRYDEFEDSEEYVRDIVIPIIKECIRVSKRVIVTPGSKCMMYYPKPDSFGCLFSNSAKGMQLWGSMDSQPIFYYGRPFDIGKRIHRCSFEVYEQPSCKEHPCSKPIRLWRNIIKLRSKEGDLILDPFMGSGTTAIACKQINRKFIGFEISKKYCELAERRLSQETMIDIIKNQKSVGDFTLATPTFVEQKAINKDYIQLRKRPKNLIGARLTI